MQQQFHILSRLTTNKAFPTEVIYLTVDIIEEKYHWYAYHVSIYKLINKRHSTIGWLSNKGLNNNLNMAFFHYVENITGNNNNRLNMFQDYIQQQCTKLAYSSI